MRHATILVAIFAFVPLASATAQEPPPVKVGDRVRVTAPDVRRREGTVQLLTTDSLVMGPESGIWPVAIPLVSVTRLERESTWTDRPPPLMWAPSFDATLSAGLLQRLSPQGRKSATTAGFLSGVCFLLPVCGLGSFYAGDAAHGLRHLGIGVASFGTLVAAVASGGNCGITLCGPEGAGLAVAIGAALAYYANGIWSIVVAAEDAHAHNRRLEQPRVAFMPAIEFLPVPPALRPTVGLRVVSVTF